MTKNEAYKLLFALNDSSCYNGYIELKEDPDVDYDKILNYFLSLDLPFQFVYDFITDQLEGYATLDNVRSNDDYDYLNLYETSDGKLDLSVWTEVCGKEYYLSEYGKTWKEYEPTRKRKKTC